MFIFVKTLISEAIKSLHSKEKKNDVKMSVNLNFYRVKVGIFNNCCIVCAVLFALLVLRFVKMYSMGRNIVTHFNINKICTMLPVFYPDIIWAPKYSAQFFLEQGL